MALETRAVRASKFPKSRAAVGTKALCLHTVVSVLLFFDKEISCAPKSNFLNLNCKAGGAPAGQSRLGNDYRNRQVEPGDSKLRGGTETNTGNTASKDLNVVIDRMTRRIKILDRRGIEVSWNSGFPRKLPKLEIMEVILGLRSPFITNFRDSVDVPQVPVPLEVEPGESYTYSVPGRGNVRVKVRAPSVSKKIKICLLTNFAGAG